MSKHLWPCIRNMTAPFLSPERLNWIPILPRGTLGSNNRSFSSISITASHSQPWPPGNCIHMVIINTSAMRNRSLLSGDILRWRWSGLLFMGMAGSSTVPSFPVGTSYVRIWLPCWSQWMTPPGSTTASWCSLWWSPKGSPKCSVTGLQLTLPLSDSAAVWILMEFVPLNRHQARWAKNNTEEQLMPSAVVSRTNGRQQLPILDLSKERSGGVERNARWPVMGSYTHRSEFLCSRT